MSNHRFPRVFLRFSCGFPIVYPPAKPGDQWYELQAHRAVNQALFCFFFVGGVSDSSGGDWKDNGDMKYNKVLGKILGIYGYTITTRKLWKMVI